MSGATRARVTPATIQAALDTAGPGTTIVLQAGTYRDRLRMTGRHGRPGRPIVIRGEKGAVLDGGRSVLDFNPVAQLLAEAAQLNRGFPGMKSMMPQAHLVLDACSYVRVEQLSIRGAWPTGIFVDNCQHIEIRDVHLEEGTYAIAAYGELTRNLSILDCSWVQDPTGTTLWRRIDWERVHGDIALPGDWRAFDGDFFRAYRIAGDVLIRGNRISHAFNGIHLFNRETDPIPTLARRVVIHGNRFSFIRDNGIEPEFGALDWWIVNNDFQDCYKTFSLDQVYTGFVNIVGNRGWFTARPGPPCDDHVSGELMKLSTRPGRVGPAHMLHNSWYLRGPLAKKALLPGLVHRNNAILACAGDPPGSPWCTPCPAEPAFFGDETTPGSEWNALGISFANDVVGHGSFPAALNRAGYPVSGIGRDPGFADPGNGGFAIGSASPCWGTAEAVELALMDGGSRTVNARHIGAWQDGHDDPFGHLLPKAGAELGDDPGALAS